MHKQLVLLHNAVSAYFSGNASALEGTIKQFNVKVNSPNMEKKHRIRWTTNNSYTVILINKCFFKSTAEIAEQCDWFMA